MAEIKTGAVVYRRTLSPIMEIFRLAPEPGSKFPGYKAGQYIALRRDNCKLTKRVIGEDRQPRYVPDFDAFGNQRRGAVTHSYSISSAPFETAETGYLEFYVVFEMQETGIPGRLSESLFHLDPHSDHTITYFNRITGEFTLGERAPGFKNVVFVGTGSGLAPFIAMVKQLHYEAMQGKNGRVRYTLFHTNRTYDELGYHHDLLDVEAVQKFDFVYVPSVSRPSARDFSDPSLGKGRANNILRTIFDMPVKEEQDLQEAQAKGGDVAKAKAALEKTVEPVLPQKYTCKFLRERMNLPTDTVILTCGNPMAMADIKYIADTNKIRFEKEDW